MDRGIVKMTLNQGYYNIESTVIRRWTQSAVDCYRLGCNCSKCNIPLIMETPCQMKRSVISLVRAYGIPDLSKFKGDNNNEI